ncbi:LOW QUALITY PROTEIN: hypothetical protein PHMEG_00039132 [Phytophthora megakarya]|uniref:Uncharacterized protein n=1 Tax=Phytophthora megakarya TaxID=4795 RepID=A0A225UFN3_9STRA|nr:LOW QUALITY PROTEIN: hypothetical protein PHMEG_00039132 [Phytophthora megakarya]
MLCGAPLELEDSAFKILYEEADDVLVRWLEHNVAWVQVAAHKTSEEKLTAETLTRLVLVRRNGAVCWSLSQDCLSTWTCVNGPGKSEPSSFCSSSPSQGFGLDERHLTRFKNASFNWRTRYELAHTTTIILKHNRAQIKRMDACKGGTVVGSSRES